MRSFNSKNMLKGYFVGAFEPSVLHIDGIEIAVQIFHKGYFDLMKKSPYAKTCIYILEGKLQIGCELYVNGDILLYDKGELKSFCALEDSKVILINHGDSGTIWDISYLSLEDIIKESNKVIMTEKCEDNNSISDEDITFLVQGPITPSYSKLCMQSIRHFFPGSKILLSTWKNSDVSDLSFDDVIFNADPGPLYYVSSKDGNLISHNLNRQLCSTRNGLSKVTTEYVMKIRADEIITSRKFLNYYDKYNEFDKRYTMFRHKIIVPEIWSMHKHRTPWGNEVYPLLFSPSDWFYFGKTEDLDMLFKDANMVTQDYFSGDFHINREKVSIGSGNIRFHAEQYIAISAIKKFFGIEMNDWTDWDKNKIEFSNHWFMNNFIVLDFLRHGVVLPKYLSTLNLSKSKDRSLFFTHELYERIYACGIDNDNAYSQPELAVAL